MPTVARRCQGVAYACLLTVVLAISSVCVADSDSISQETARNLVRNALVAAGQSPKAFHIETIRNPDAPDFYAFQAAWYNPKGPALILYFALNPETGDVWDAVMCRRITSSAIRKEQELIRGRLKISAQAWKSLTAKSPGCSENER